MKNVIKQIDRELIYLFIRGLTFEIPSIVVEINYKWSFISIYNFQNLKFIRLDEESYPWKNTDHRLVEN